MMPPTIPISLNVEGQARIPIPTKALKVLVKDSEFVSFTMYFSDLRNLYILESKEL
jgi:hypothetical protein